MQIQPPSAFQERTKGPIQASSSSSTGPSRLHTQFRVHDHSLANCDMQRLEAHQIFLESTRGLLLEVVFVDSVQWVSIRDAQPTNIQSTCSQFASCISPEAHNLLHIPQCPTRGALIAVRSRACVCSGSHEYSQAARRTRLHKIHLDCSSPLLHSSTSTTASFPQLRHSHHHHYRPTRTFTRQLLQLHCRAAFPESQARA